jgi:antitoxin component YwqK of YwqJK toxin-antitoxin module
MKNHLIISLLFLSVGLSQQEYDINDLIEMDNGLWTVKFSDEPISGKVFGYWFLGEDNNKKKVYVGNLRNGIKSGKWTTWYYNGRKGSEITYKNGKRDGLYNVWYENGQKEQEGTYKDGKKGLRTGWYKNGQKEREVHYKDGDYDVIRRWNEDGSVRKEPFWWE